MTFDSLPNDKISDMIKLKAFADDKSNMAEVTNSPCDSEESTVGKGENAGFQSLLL